MDIIYFGQQNWHVSWTTKQHLLMRLARRGMYRVLYIDPDPACNDIKAGLRREGHNLWVLSHHRRLPPYPGPKSWRKRLRVAKAARKLRFFEPVAVVAKPWHNWEALGFVPSGRVYFAEDEWSAMGGPPAYRATLAKCEGALVRDSDITLAVAPTLLEKFRPLQPRVHLQENAVDPDHFSSSDLPNEPGDPHPAIAALRALPRPRIGFVGQIDTRMDFALMTDLARRRPGWQFVFVGKVHGETDAGPLEAISNVTLTGPVSYDDLPAVMRELDVATIPYLANERGRGCNPLKAYEYLAAGLPIVSTPLPGLGKARPNLVEARDADGFERAIEAILNRSPAERLVDAANRRSAVAGETWDARTDAFEARLHEARRLRGTAAHVPQRQAAPTPGGCLATTSMPGQTPRVSSYRSANPQLPLLRRGELKPTPGPRRNRGEPDLKDRAAQEARYETEGKAAGRLRCAAKLSRIASRLLPSNAPAALVARANSCHLGDLIALVPTLRALRKAKPDWRIDLGADPPTTAEQVLAGSSHVDRVFPLALTGTTRDRMRRVKRLFKRRYRLLITGATNYFSATLCLCGAKRQIGIADGWPGQKLLTDSVPLDPSAHEIDNNLAPLRRIGLPVDSRDRSRGERMEFDEKAIDTARPDILRLLGPSPKEDKLLLVHPGSKRPSRRMPLPRLADAVRQVLAARPDVRVAVTGSPDETALAAELLQEIGTDRAVNLSGRTTLPALVALVDAADVVLSPDTGVMHLARARGRPLAALLGPGNPRRWGPYPEGDAPAIALRHRVPCAPCDRWNCDYHWCMRLLEPAEVADAVLELLEGDCTATTLQMRERHHTWMKLATTNDMPDLPVIDVQWPGDPAKVIRWLAQQEYPALRVRDANGRTIAELPLVKDRAADHVYRCGDGLPTAWELEFEIARWVATSERPASAAAR